MQEHKGYAEVLEPLVSSVVRSQPSHRLAPARAAWWRPDTQRRCAELLAALEAVLDTETLERLLAEGNALDEKRCVR